MGTENLRVFDNAGNDVLAVSTLDVVEDLLIRTVLVRETAQLDAVVVLLSD